MSVVPSKSWPSPLAAFAIGLACLTACEPVLAFPAVRAPGAVESLDAPISDEAEPGEPGSDKAVGPRRQIIEPSLPHPIPALHASPSGPRPEIPSDGARPSPCGLRFPLRC